MLQRPSCRTAGASPTDSRPDDRRPAAVGSVERQLRSRPSRRHQDRLVRAPLQVVHRVVRRRVARGGRHRTGYPMTLTAADRRDLRRLHPRELDAARSWRGGEAPPIEEQIDLALTSKESGVEPV